MSEALRLLLVDDEPLALRRIKSFNLRSHGFEIVGEASNGKQALDCLERQNIDIVITDIGMPVMNGLELLKCLQTQPAPPKVVLLTCYEDFEKVQTALRYGAQDYVTKVLLSEQELIDVLLRAADSLRAEEPQSHADETPAEQSDPPLITGVTRSEIKEALLVIEQNFATIDLVETARRVNLSPSWFASLFRCETGDSFHGYVTATRLREAKKLLRTTDYKVYEVAEHVGIPNYRYFSRLFAEHTGVTPLVYRKNRLE
ncbi:response regulator transcription factor [Paenibacillus sacheonensis]|uniref:Response regulator n=1 Tax=Paenibacillus sacheonensis TaxID=742054 RepID=A0A7X4YTM4_9BACL|nr:response regulator [Paenibacillus sacheonensis]MBM7568524.1 YesN/AraC family two-component response regulator [Paenibacillus sacheonensis]NBC72350.1 response regulator [Paenibacillus sacheonensis]